MKTDALKTLIKEAVREAIQEVVHETLRDTYAQPHLEKPKQLTAAERQAMFGGILGEMQNGGAATSQYAGNFNPAPVDTINGSLPAGEVGLDQIMGLMSR